ncbi:MAG TPA: thioredoxin domain-containing protein [Candidatus Limnocylindria bacterium]|nr:thioredoxin domain-containing protein [Candidatus Limnocylindria bacterium]
MRTALILLGTALLVATALAPGWAQHAEPPVSEPAPSTDLPPIETTSRKVKASKNPDFPPALGPAPTMVYVIVFCDYRDDRCARMTRAVRQIANEWPEEVRVEFRHFPQAGHAWAKGAAVAALAAHRQGKFWEMHDCLFAHQPTLDDSTPETCARETGLDLARFERDRTSPRLAARVDREVALARRLGIHQVPAYTINGRLFVGWGTWELLRGSVDEERRQMAALRKQGKSIHQAQVARSRQNAPKSADALAAYAELMKHLHGGLAPAARP